MEDLDIIKQLMSGNHLEKQELQRGREVLKRLTIELKMRCL